MSKRVFGLLISLLAVSASAQVMQQVAGNTGAQITQITSASNATTSGTNVVTVAIPLRACAVLVSSINAGAARTITIADTGGNTWHEIDSRTNTNAAQVDVWTLLNAAADTSVTVTYSGSYTNAFAAVDVFSSCIANGHFNDATSSTINPGENLSLAALSSAVITGIGCVGSTTVASNQGNLRQSGNTGLTSAMLDTIGIVTNQVTLGTSSACVLVSVELTYGGP